MVGLNDLKVLFQPTQFYDSMILNNVSDRAEVEILEDFVSKCD